MSYFSKINSMYNNELQINNPDGGDVDITSTTGQVKINGVVPSGGGGSELPIEGVGNITITGNIDANGDGVSTGLLEAETIKTNGNLLFDSYSFRPTELVYSFTGATLDATPPPIFNSLTTNFTKTNDNTQITLNSLGENVYFLTIDATSSSGTTIGSSRFMCSFPYMVSANASGSFELSGNFANNINNPASFQTPKICANGSGGPVGSTNFAYCFPSITGTETFDGIVRITKLIN